jgi:hypothetical protein
VHRYMCMICQFQRAFQRSFSKLTSPFVVINFTLHERFLVVILKMASQASDNPLPVLSGTCGAMLPFFRRPPLTYFAIHFKDIDRNAFYAVWNGITDAQKTLLAGLLQLLLDMAANPLGRTNILLGFSYNLICHDDSTEHASNVSHLLAILTDLPMDAVEVMLLLTGTREVFFRRGVDSVSALTSHFSGADTDESPHGVTDFPYIP